ncbi:hypothetical protein FRC12_009766 [Ceratobasidium sp. 428]|nr:hypothetical protein FRC12_009766 [Ceratobasidium sp. 428]
MDHASLLRRLQQYRDAWLDLKIQPPIDHHCGDEWVDSWELRDGVFAKAFGTQGTRVGSPHSVLILPLDVDGARTRINFGMTFNEFTMDLGQGLVVLAGLYPDQPSRSWLGLRSSITGKVHPQAKHPLLAIELPFNLSTDAAPSLTLEIKHDLVAAKFAASYQRKYEILIWNWKTGRLLHRISCDNGICNFMFLDSNRLVVWSACSTDENNDLVLVGLNVYGEIDCASSGFDAPDSGSFDVIAFPKLEPTFTFQFPKIQTSSSVNRVGFLLRLDYGSGSGFAAFTPFSTSRALTLDLTMSIETGTYLSSLRIFVDVRQLIHHMDRARERSVSKLRWDEWGEHATRWFRADHPARWIYWIFGSRASFEDGHLSVVDFHTPTVRRHANRRQDTYFSSEKSEELIEKRRSDIHEGFLPGALFEHDMEHDQLNESNRATMTENAVIVDSVTSQEPTTFRFFDEPVMSRLPYRMVTPVKPLGSHECWLISGKQLIGMSHSFGLATSDNYLTVYTIGELDDEDMSNV